MPRFEGDLAWYWSKPELKATTGVPASTAARTAGAIASGFARVTAMPSTRLSMALWTRLAWFGDSGSEE
ncbi:hypothetical protein SAMN04490220_8675 [Rhodococcus jostii]|uniref:Uncharacterized protein n=1 Tax=Rhodococcus jostii TaxID=132919 RepID=A0A1H5M5I9_RHOJO|nr:hypothetical protein SAMN04490220_8675 [Rhodococcus jostii]